MDRNRLPEGEFPVEMIEERCVPKPDGSPKKSVYLAIYRVLSRVPVEALGSLYLVTRDGLTLELKRGEYQREPERQAHLYQEFCPIDPMVASCPGASGVLPGDHGPGTTGACAAHCVFPTRPCVDWRPTRCGERLTTCRTPICSTCARVLASLLESDHKSSKLFLKHVNAGVYYRTIRGGFYVGDQEDFAFYPIPSPGELESSYYNWWRSAQFSGGD